MARGKADTKTPAAESGASGAAASGQTTTSSVGPKGETSSTKTPSLAANVQTLQFAWFIGHVVTVVSTLMYFFTYLRVFPSAYKFWYKLALFGVIESFSLLIFQSAKKTGFNARLLIKDDNVQYSVLALALFFYSPYVLLTLTPFALYSMFHVLSYARTFLFPAFGIADTHPLSVKVGNFITANNNNSIVLASLLEVYTVAWMFIRVITFRKNSLIPFFVYVVFIKLRYESSAFTRNAFKSAELKIEGLVNQTGVPALKEAWVSVKGVFHKVGSVPLVNDYTKEKSI